jgi:branched-chain amino acid transport system substrate-binding protein
MRCISLLVLSGLLVAADNVTIVSNLPRTGSANVQSATMVNGIMLALEEAKYQAGPFTVTYRDWDDASPEKGQWDPALEAANADKAIADPDVMVMIGPYNSGAAKISMPKLNQAGLAQISPSTTWPGLTKPGVGESNEPAIYRPSGAVSFFRVVPADDLQGAVGAEWAKDMGATRAFVLHDRELYGQGLAKMFRKTAERIKLDVVGYEGIDGKAANYRSLMTKIRMSRAEVVYFGGTTESGVGQLAKDLAANNVNAKLIVPDGCFNHALFESASPAALNGRIFLTFGGVPPERLTGRGQAFVTAYRARFHAEPEAYSVYAYECARVALDAIARAGRKDRAAVRAALAATHDFDGALGHWSFDANGDISLTVLSGNTVKDGQFSFVKLLGQ